MLLLIDTRIPPQPPPGPRRRRRLPRLDPRVARWLVLAVVLLAAGMLADGLAGAVLLLAGLVAACAAATTALPYGSGLAEHRQ